MGRVSDVGTVMKLPLTLPISETASMEKESSQAVQRAAVDMFPVPVTSLQSTAINNSYRVLAVDDYPTIGYYWRNSLGYSECKQKLLQVGTKRWVCGKQKNLISLSLTATCP